MKKLMMGIVFLFTFCSSVFAADIYWTGSATAVAQVDKFVPANVEVGDIFTLTITGWDGTTAAVSFTATAATVDNVVTGAAAAWNASTNALCTPITADPNTADDWILLTADTAGTAFSVASTETDGGVADTQTFTRSAVTASAGPSHWDSVGNWSTGALPGGAASQNVYIQNSAAQILYGLNQGGIANALDSLNIEKTFTGRIGVNGATGKTGTYLQILATAVNIGKNPMGVAASGSGRIMIDTGATASTVSVFALASSPVDTGKPSARFKSNSVSTDFNIYTGKVGIAYEPGETTTFDDAIIGYNSTGSSDTVVTIGSGVTLDDITKRIGTLYLSSAVDALTNESGAAYINGTGTVGTLTIESGTVYSNTTGTITTASANGGTLDLSGSLTARTITTMNIGDGGSLLYDPAIITITNGITLTETSGKFLITSAEQ